MSTDTTAINQQTGTSRTSTKSAFANCIIILIIALSPIGYLSFRARRQRVEPLSVPVILTDHRFSSPTFKMNHGDTYQLDITFSSIDTPLDIKWQVVDISGTVLGGGRHEQPVPGGNNIVLGQYRATDRTPKKIVIEAMQGSDSFSNAATLHAGLPEVSLENGYVSLFAWVWAGMVIVIGLISFTLTSFRHRRPFAI